MNTARGNCPHCGKETEGIHIAGSVYDFQCGPCADDLDRSYRDFIDATVYALSVLPLPEDGRKV